MIPHDINWWDISVVQVSLLCQRYLTKSVNVRYFCGISFPAMSSQWYLTKLVGEIFLWYMIQVIQVVQLIQDNQVSLSHLRVHFRVYPNFPKLRNWRLPFNTHLYNNMIPVFITCIHGTGNIVELGLNLSVTAQVKISSRRIRMAFKSYLADFVR